MLSRRYRVSTGRGYGGEIAAPRLKKKKTLGLSWAWKDSAYIDFFFFVSLRKTNYVLVALRKSDYVSQHGS